MTMGGVHYYIAPSYVMARQIAWRLLKEIAKDWIVYKNESLLCAELEGGGMIYLKGAENKDSLRGVSLSSAVLDEFAFMDRDVWDMVI